MANEQQLSDVLSEFARTLVTDFPIQAILDHLVERIVDVLPITAAGVTLIAPGVDPHYVAASDESALRFEELQTQLGEGPCVEAYKTGEAVAVADLRDERRFPAFSRRALEAGLGAVFTFPLRNGDDQLGALDIYRDSPGALDDDAMRAAQTLADVASAYILNAQARADLRDSTERSREQALHDPLTGLPNRALLAVLSGTGIDPKFVTLKITENVFDDGERALTVLRELRGIGVTLALDAFGTGPSSVNSLARFPIEIVKIDRAVIAGLAHDPASHAVVFAVVELAHILSMVVVAEGVETAEQHRHLAALGCDRGQGQYFAPPMGADDIDAWLADAAALGPRSPLDPPPLIRAVSSATAGPAPVPDRPRSGAHGFLS